MEGKVAGSINQVQGNPMQQTPADPLSQGATDSFTQSLGQLDKWAEDRIKLKYPVNGVPTDVIELLARVQKNLEAARIEWEQLVKTVNAK
jgi:hypothetical protein